MKRTTWIFLILLILVLGVYLLLKYDVIGQSEPTPTATATTTAYLFSEADGTLIGLQVSDRQQNVVLLERDAVGTWFVSLPAEGQADQGLAGAAETQVGALRIATSFEATPDPAAAGLQSPQYTIRLTYDSGALHILEVGATSPTGRGYYVRLDSGSVFLVSQAGIDALVNLLAAPPYQPTATATLEPSATSTPEMTATATLEATTAVP